MKEKVSEYWSGKLMGYRLLPNLMDNLNIFLENQKKKITEFIDVDCEYSQGCVVI